MNKITILFAISCLFTSTTFAVELPKHNDKDLMNLIKTYETLGPKVPGTAQHKKTGDWIVSELKKAGFSVKEQKGKMKLNGKDIPIRNILGQFNPKAKIRYLLSAHWDTRPMADQDKKDKDKPILGVNDGGSGVAVLLSVAKRVNFIKNKSIGVDVMFFDAEDMGQEDKLTSYCLGAQYWVQNVMPENYRAQMAINFDMVGAKDAVFPMEEVTKKVGLKVRKAIVKSAKELGFSSRFPEQEIRAILDDHVFVSQLYFPVAEMIGTDPKGKFFPEWHTHKDTSEIISLETLNIVIDVTLNLLKNEAQSPTP